MFFNNPSFGVFPVLVTGSNTSGVEHKSTQRKVSSSSRNQSREQKRLHTDMESLAANSKDSKKQLRSKNSHHYIQVDGMDSKLLTQEADVHPYTNTYHLVDPVEAGNLDT